MQDIEALPGQPNALALMRLGGGFTSEVVVYDGAAPDRRLVERLGLRVEIARARAEQAREKML